MIGSVPVYRDTSSALLSPSVSEQSPLTAAAGLLCAAVEYQKSTLPSQKAAPSSSDDKLGHYPKNLPSSSDGKLNHSPGFTLLEVLVALAIVAVAAAGVMALGNDLFRQLGNARDMDDLALLAREVAYRHGADLRHPARKEGDCEAPNQDCRWMIRTESTGGPGMALERVAVSTGELGMALVRVTVECGRDRTITIERTLPILGGGL